MSDIIERPNMDAAQRFQKKYTVDSKDPPPDGYFLRKEVNLESCKGCANCGDTLNMTEFMASAWTRVYLCRRCGAFVRVWEQDRMGGVFYDVYTIYLP